MNGAPAQHSIQVIILKWKNHVQRWRIKPSSPLLTTTTTLALRLCLRQVCYVVPFSCDVYGLKITTPGLWSDDYSVTLQSDASGGSPSLYLIPVKQLYALLLPTFWLYCLWCWGEPMITQGNPFSLHLWCMTIPVMLVALLLYRMWNFTSSTAVHIYL